VVTNASGSVTSSVAMLAVTQPIPLAFSSASLSGSNGFKLTLTGEPGSTAAIWRSEDLTNWVNITNLSLSTGTAEFIDGIDPLAAQRFYRAQMTP
jgi:hypothetical protein